MPNYYLVALSNRTNLDLCIRYALAGFTNSANGFWTYNEIDEGDFVSFLYGARAWNLYRVTRKTALRDAADLPPWPPVIFRASGKSYYFPFRLQLEPVRSLQESLVRPEFGYVAENLLLRGGYRKTHFQADQTTLQAVSQMGTLYAGDVEQLDGNFEAYSPLITFTRSDAEPPSVYQFSEVILQALLKKYLRDSDNLRYLLGNEAPADRRPVNMEVLGELALPEGQVDILVKEATPIGVTTKIAVEVKLGAASVKDIDQLANYVVAVGPECRAGVLIAREASPRVISYAAGKEVDLRLYNITTESPGPYFAFDELLAGLSLLHP